MANLGRQKVIVMVPTHDLFNRIEAQAASLVAQTKKVMHLCVEESKLSRKQLVERMNGMALMAGVRLTAGNSKSLRLATLDKWLNAKDREYIPGLLALNIFCGALDDARPLAVQLELHGIQIMSPDDVWERDYGRVIQRERAIKKERRKLEKERGL